MKGVIEYVRDITERKQAEERLERVNRALRTLGECNEVLIRATDESKLLQEICWIIVEIGGYHLAWVGYAEHDKKKTVRPVAQSDYDKGYLNRINITWAENERGQGPTGIAIRTGKPSICKNILTDPKYTP
jgi:GAF domain-containing protein